MPNLNFDLNAVDASQSSNDQYEQLPEGDYEVRVTNTEGRTSKNGTDFISVEFTVVGPTYAGRKIWDNHFVYSEKEFPRTRFKWLVQAAGLNSIAATEELHGRTLGVTVKHGGPNKEYVNVDAYHLTSSAPPAPAAPAAPAASGPAPKPWAA